MNSKHIWLLRHGEPVGGDSKIRGQSDDPLTELGWQQLWQATRSLKVDHVFSSPLQRCAAFGESYARQNQLAFSIIPELIEMGMGSWEGKSKTEVFTSSDMVHRYARNPSSCLPKDAEPFTSITLRAMDVLGQLAQTSEQNLLVVAHAGIIRFIMAQVLDIPIESAMRIKLPFAACVPLTLIMDETGIFGQLHWPKTT
jgi:alpha-ribazole phosphatase/probable phosphoglycerate mutase